MARNAGAGYGPPERSARPARQGPLLLMLLALALPSVALSSTEPLADVVVVVDTSFSMKEQGMDRERGSLLVSKLLADIVPGELTVIRLYMPSLDAHLLPTRATGEMGPCPDDPTQQCQTVEPQEDPEEAARSKKIGALVRPTRGDRAYKKTLEQHLEQNATNTRFHMAFRAAQGVFGEHRAAGKLPQGATRSLVWLSDGRAYEPQLLRRAIGDLQADGVRVEAIVFGRGDTTIAEGLGLETSRVSSPAEIMKAFAGAFRRIVQAPYRIDNRVDLRPEFEMKPYVDEAWIVVYGDDTLEEASVKGPRGTVAADYAADRWPGAGAYRVAYLSRPRAGKWTVQAVRGGPGVAYAVVQRSALGPDLLEPDQALAGVPVPLVVGIRAGDGGELITDPEVLARAEVSALVQGERVRLTDDGTQGDVTAGDGLYTGAATFRGSGRVPVQVNLRMELVDRSIEEEVEVSGFFSFTGEPVEIDFGSLRHGEESCRELRFAAEHLGEVPFELEARRSLPARHGLELRLPGGVVKPGGRARSAAPGDPMTLCLVVLTRAPSSSAAGEPWLELRVAGSRQADHTVPLLLTWRVQGASFWERWGRLLLLILILLIITFIILGYVWPKRFQRALAVAFVPEREDLDEQQAQPLRQWKGVGIGFYRHARAFLHPDFRISGAPRGALAGLYAERSGTRVAPARGRTLYRETLDGDWEEVALAGRKARSGDVYRVGDTGPFFRIATRAGR